MSSLNSLNATVTANDWLKKFCEENPDSDLCSGRGGGTGGNPPFPDDGSVMPPELASYLELLAEQGQELQPSQYNIIAAMCNNAGLPQWAAYFAQDAFARAAETDYLPKAQALQLQGEAYEQQGKLEQAEQAIEQAEGLLSMYRAQNRQE